MSASWGSEMRRERGWPGAVGASVALAVALVVGLVLGAAAAVDSGRVVRHVRIGPAGIRVEEYGRGDSAWSAEPRVRTRERDVIRLGRHGVTVESSDGESVSVGEGGDGTVHGPGIVIDGGDAGLVRVFDDAHIPAGHTIQGDVVAVFGSVDVEGTVAGDVIAVFGSVRLHPGAIVEGDAVAIGGVLDHPASARVSGQSVALGFFMPGWGVPTLAALLMFVVLGWLATLFLGWLLALLFPERMLRVGATASRHAAGSFFLGVLSAPLFVIALVLLFVTVVGIPFALLLPFVYLFAIWAGQVAASYVLGCKVLRRRPGEGGLMGPITVGTLLVGLLLVAGAILAVPQGPSRTLSLFFTMLGVLLIAGLSTIGTGALLLSRLGSKGAAPVPAAPAGGTPPAGPAAVA